RGEIAAEGKGRQQSALACASKRPRDALGRVVAARGREFELSLDLAGILRAPQQFVLEAGIGDRQHRRDDVAVRLPAQVGDPVFRHHDVAQMTRNGGVAVVPKDGRGRAPPRRSGCAQRDDRARAGKRKTLRDEIVLCPPTPLTTWPFSSASETTAPSSVAIMALLTKRAFTRARRFCASPP